MKKAILFTWLLMLRVFAFYPTESIAQKTSYDTWPVPKNVKDLLFYVQRDPDANTVVYQLNLDETGQLQENQPINIFWIRYAEGGARKELNYIQKKFAYGLDVKKLAKEQFELTFVSYNKLKLYLRKDNQGNYRVFTSIDQKQAILDRVFVRVEGGTFWVPNVLYVELKGHDAALGKPVMERFKP